MNKKLFAAICASAMILAACTACGDNTDVADNSSQIESSDVQDDFGDAEEESSEESSVETAAPVETVDVEFEDPVVAESGDAILAITDGQWYVQYWGKDTDLLTYDAGIAHIDGDGSYTVSVNVGTKGAQYDIGGDPEGDYQCEGIAFAMVQVVDGTTLFPNMSIEVTEIRVDGTPINLIAKNYTSSDNGVEMRANIYNEYVSNFPDDAHTAEGAVTGEFGEYSSKIIDLADVAKWTKIEVDFTVTGTGEGAAEGDEAGGEEEAADDGAEQDAEGAEE